MQRFEGSKGYVAQAADNGTFVTVLTAPAGHHIKVTYFLVAATGAVTVDAKWVKSGTDVVFLHAKNMNASDLVEFGGSEGKFLILTDQDTIQVKCSAADATVIISYELFPHQGSNIVL